MLNSCALDTVIFLGILGLAQNSPDHSPGATDGAQCY